MGKESSWTCFTSDQSCEVWADVWYKARELGRKVLACQDITAVTTETYKMDIANNIIDQCPMCKQSPCVCVKTKKTSRLTEILHSFVEELPQCSVDKMSHEHKRDYLIAFLVRKVIKGS